MRYGKVFAYLYHVESGEDTIQQKIMFLMFLRNTRLRNRKVFEPINHVCVLDLLKSQYYNLKETKSSKFTVNATLPFHIIPEPN